jgi:hypothetical protein
MNAAVVVRPDISDKLVHFTSGANNEAAFFRLMAIVNEGVLRGSGEKIRGGHTCVCFTEAPLNSLQGGLVNPTAFSRYSPFGIIVEKAWLFGHDGRPVIYQPELEYGFLPPELAWRHMRYEPPEVDFTWEREWRIRCDELHFDPFDAGIVVPDATWAHRIIRAHDAEQNAVVHGYSQIMSADLAEFYREGYPWRIFCLNA